MDLSNFKLIRLNSDIVIPSTFNCGDEDLNDFLINDSKNYQEELLAVTYLLIDKSEIVAYFSLLNDRISIQDVESKRKWSKYFRDIMPTGKRFRSYPAMKIGRLGVSEKYKCLGIGTMIIDYVKQLFISNNRTGCKYITVDAYRQSLSFYEKNDFLYLTSEDLSTLLISEDLHLGHFNLLKNNL